MRNNTACPAMRQSCMQFPISCTEASKMSTSEQERLHKARDFLLRAVESLGESNPTALASTSNTQPRVRARPAAPASSSSASGSKPSRITSIIGERNKLFNFNRRAKPKLHTPKSKKKRLSVWTHDFVCLASTTARKPPTSLEAGELLRAGLGKKQVSILDGGDSSEVHAEIMNSFPKLAAGGGYDLLRVGDTGGQRDKLKLIPPPSEGYTVCYLKEVLRQAKVYVRPMQQNLPLEPTVSNTIVSLVGKKLHPNSICIWTIYNACEISCVDYNKWLFSHK